MSNNLLERWKQTLFSPAAQQWALLLTICFFMFLLLLCNRSWSHRATEIDQKLEGIQARLQSIASYDLDVLAVPSQKMSQLSRMSSTQSQNIKFVSEATTESRKIKEIPYSMPVPVTVTGSSLLHILDILHPSKELSAPADIWVKYLKIRKDREHFSLQMSLISRELKP